MGACSSSWRKPSLEELRSHFQLKDEREFDLLPRSRTTGFYLVETSVLRAVAEHPEVEAMRRSRLDFGKDLLPRLVANGHEVRTGAVRRIGDLGNVEYYVDTMRCATARSSGRAPESALPGRLDEQGAIGAGEPDVDGGLLGPRRRGRGPAGGVASGGVAVYPRLEVPTGIQVPPGTELTGAEDVLQFLERRMRYL